MQFTFHKLFMLFIFYFLLFFLQPLQAMPDQRFIIYFDKPLNGNQKTNVHNSLKTHLHDNYLLAEHSDDSRWIVILKFQLNDEALKKIINNLREHKLVRHIELDDLLKINTNTVIH